MTQTNRGAPDVLVGLLMLCMLVALLVYDIYRPSAPHLVQMIGERAKIGRVEDMIAFEADTAIMMGLNFPYKQVQKLREDIKRTCFTRAEQPSPSTKPQDKGGLLVCSTIIPVISGVKDYRYELQFRNAKDDVRVYKMELLAQDKNPSEFRVVLVRTGMNWRLWFGAPLYLRKDGRSLPDWLV
ncbi:MAG: hypothetical protein N2690_00480 [Rhodocyclaceae bacterium]|nr:hypothetical protein [Rhodocyclaceae bacterium]